MPATNIEDLIALCKRRGFIFQSSEIYGGTQGLYDYGPLGVELKNNIKNSWWKSVVYERDLQDLDMNFTALQASKFNLHFERLTEDPTCSRTTALHSSSTWPILVTT